MPWKGALCKPPPPRMPHSRASLPESPDGWGALVGEAAPAPLTCSGWAPSAAAPSLRSVPPPPGGAASRSLSLLCSALEGLLRLAKVQPSCPPARTLATLWKTGA